ncbi:MAG: DUF4304 domain-containing protein [Bacteriovoracaceae bacterium]|nr:DUF4304 domain-containing protein [Bacteriovoracaceae bacterium]
MNKNELTPQERFNAIIKDCMAPLLKKNGFKKKGTKFTREDEDLIYIVKTYKSQWNTKEELDFRIEWGLEIKEEKKKPGLPFYGEVLQGDLYDFTKDAELQWFHLKHENIDLSLNDKKVKETIYYNLDSKIIPFLFSFHFIQDVITLLENSLGKQVQWGIPGGAQTLDWLATLYYFIDKPEKSLNLIEQAIQEATIDSYQKELQETRQDIITLMSEEK